MKKLILYYLKKRTHVILIITVIMLLLFSAMYLNVDFIHTYFDYDNNEVTYAINSPLGNMTLIFTILASIVPLFEFQFKMRKVNIDQLYSLPIKREKLYLTKYIIGLIEIIVPFIIIWFYILLILLFNENIFYMQYYYLYFIFMILGLICIYTIICFVYTRNNTVIDGLINIILSIFVLTLISNFIVSFISKNNELSMLQSYLILYSPISDINYIFDSYFTENSLEISNNTIISFVIYGLISIITFILFIILNKKDKSENAMQFSDSFFSYRVMIPIYMVFLTFMLDFTFIMYVICMILGYIGFVIYRRTFKIGKKYLILYGIMVLLSLFVTIIF